MSSEAEQKTPLVDEDNHEDEEGMDEDLDDLLDGCTQDLDKKLQINDAPSKTVISKEQTEKPTATPVMQTTEEPKQSSQQNPLNSEDPFGLNDPEFKDTLKEILNDDAQAQEAMQGLQQMMSMVNGMMKQQNPSGSDGGSATSQDDILQAQKLFEQMSNAASMGQSANSTDGQQNKNPANDADIKQQEEQAMSFLQQMLSQGMDQQQPQQQQPKEQPKDQEYDKIDQKNEEVKKETSGLEKKEDSTPNVNANTNANPFDNAAQQLFKNLEQTSQKTSQQTKPSSNPTADPSSMPEMDEQEAKAFEQNFMKMFEGLAKSLEEEEEDQNGSQPQTSQDEEQAAKEAEQLMKNMFSMFGGAMQGMDESNQNNSNQSQQDDPFAALMNQMNQDMFK